MTAGAMLRDARQAAGIHIAALAVALKVPVSKLEALESDNYDALPDTVFVRALASSMCRTLKLDPAPVLSLLPQNKGPRLATDNGGLNAPMKGRSGKSSSLNSFSSSSTSRSVTLIVLALLVGALVLVFLPRQPASDAQSATKNVPAAPQPVADVVEQPSVAAIPSGPASSSAPAESATASSAPVVAERATAVSAAVVAAMPGAAASVPLGPASATTPATGALVLRARSQSWVQVKDATGAVALQRSLVAGESVSVAGPTPLAVVVGRADVTEALVHGKPFDLAAVSRENVARFEVK